MDFAIQAAVHTVGADNIIRIVNELNRARTDHKLFAYDHDAAADTIKSENLEWESQAMMVKHNSNLNTSVRVRSQHSKNNGMAYTLLKYLDRNNFTAKLEALQNVAEAAKEETVTD